MGFFTGEPQRVEQVSKFSPQQQDVHAQLLQLLSQQLGQSGFQGIEDEARRGFQQQTVPGIMERLTSMGGAHSSALGQTLGAAGAGLESQLAGQRGQFQQNQLQMLLGSGFQPHMENIIKPEQQGLLQALLSALGGGAGLAGGLALGRGAGQLGSGLSSLFSGGR